MIWLSILIGVIVAIIVVVLVRRYLEYKNLYIEAGVIPPKAKDVKSLYVGVLLLVDVCANDNCRFEKRFDFSLYEKYNIVAYQLRWDPSIITDTPMQGFIPNATLIQLKDGRVIMKISEEYLDRF